MKTTVYTIATELMTQIVVNKTLNVSEHTKAHEFDDKYDLVIYGINPNKETLKAALNAVRDGGYFIIACSGSLLAGVLKNNFNLLYRHDDVTVFQDECLTGCEKNAVLETQKILTTE